MNQYVNERDYNIYLLMEAKKRKLLGTVTAKDIGRMYGITFDRVYKIYNRVKDFN